jgi:hypothetical protein
VSTTPPPLAADLTAGLRRLKLAAMHRLAPELLVTEKTQRWNPEEFLRTLIESEITARDESNARTRMRQASFPVTKRLGEFDTAASSIPQATFDYLASLEWIRGAENACFIGPAGTGKSNVLVGLGVAAVLEGHVIHVPSAFSAADIQGAPTSDPRIAVAIEYAADGQVTQYLAVAPQLLERYRNAPPVGNALITAAMDARRLGAGPSLPRALLVAAAPSYLTDAEWAVLSDDWAEDALAYATAGVVGGPGPLVRVRPRLGVSNRLVPSGSESTVPNDSPAEPRYLLADYLEQSAQASRNQVSPPSGFWLAALEHADHGDLPRLGAAARSRGLLRTSASLWRRRAIRGDVNAVINLAEIMLQVGADNLDFVRWVAERTAVNDPRDAAHLLDVVRRGSSGSEARNLAERVIASLDISDLTAVCRLIDTLHKIGAADQVAVLASRTAVHAELSDPGAVADLLESLTQAGARQQVTKLAERLADRGEDGLYLHLEAQEGRYRFGREPDGSPSEQWGWDDL